MEDNVITFYSNDESNLHCFQATMAMMLSKLIPERQFTLSELVKLSGSIDGMSTWPSRMLIELQKMGLEIVMIEGFDGKRFIAQGADYLRDAFGDETASWQIANSDIAKEQQDYQEMYNQAVHVENRIPELSDIQQYLSEGYMVKCNVNSKRLNNEEGYVGHSVLVLAVEDDKIILHNPGLPPHPNQEVNAKTFLAAWASPNESAKEMIAIRRG